MEPVVIACGGCGSAIRIRHPEKPGRRICPRCRSALTVPGTVVPARRPPRRVPSLVMNTSIMAALAVWAGWGGLDEAARVSSARAIQAQTISLDLTQDAPAPVALSPPVAKTAGDSVRPEASPGPSPLPAALTPVVSTEEKPRPRVAPAPPISLPPPTPAAVKADVPAPAPDGVRYRVRDENGRPVVARLHGQHGRESVLMLPDGQLGLPTMLVPTDEPFRHLTADELLPQLQQGPLGAFQVLRTPHYLIFYRSTLKFAQGSGRLLEDLYDRLLQAFRKHDMPVHESEFPLVAAIYRTEEDFRASRKVDPEIQAYYEILTNRIYFYESSERDQHAPEITALRKPQTVAHEGTHQILQNIGVHPRLAAWPIWLVEGLAEYCATPCSGRRKGPAWDGLGMINGLHLATIRELDDPHFNAIHGQDARGKNLLREPGQPLVELLVRKQQLSPTEYALAWAMTHYLAFKRSDDFIAYLKEMSKIAPLEPKTQEDHLRAFQKAFGQDLAKVDKAIGAYLRKLAKQKGYDPMPFYAVMFEQPLPPSLIRRAGMVSQSPQMIQQWIEEIINPHGGQANWQALPHGTHAAALSAVEGWMRGY
jgi:hypothetical protein